MEGLQCIVRTVLRAYRLFLLELYCNNDIMCLFSQIACWYTRPQVLVVAALHTFISQSGPAAM